jgi:sirohydrochlorin ferrochelatase
LKALLLIAHGSRKETANEEVRELAGRIRQHSDNDYAAVVPAFLEFAEPDILAGIDYCAKMGAKDITVMPYFLFLGSHVARDIPNELTIASGRYPEVNLHLTRHFGAADGVVESVINCARSVNI